MDIYDDPEWHEFVAAVRREALEKIAKSAVVISLVPSGDTDIKFAVELGLSVMLDKPIIAVVMPGAHVPERLRRVADEVVECDIDTEEGREEMAETLRDFMARFP